MKLLISLIICLLFISSCTIEKRLYNKGFHVEWRKSPKAINSNNSQEGLTVDAESSDAEKESQTLVADSLALQNVEDSGLKTDDTKSGEDSDNQPGEITSGKEKNSTDTTPDDQAHTGKEAGSWIAIFPMIFIVTGTILPFSALAEELVLLTLLAIILMVLGYSIFSTLRKKSKSGSRNYAITVSVFYWLTLIFNILGTAFLMAIETLYEESPVLPITLVYYWVLFALLLISIVRSVKASKDEPLPRDFALKVIMAIVMLAICTFKTISFI